MKTVLLILLGTLGGLYAAYGIIQAYQTFTEANTRSAYGVAHISASVLPICLGLLVALVCFKRVGGKAKVSHSADNQVK